MSNLSEIRCASVEKLKHVNSSNSSNKLVLAPGVPVRLLGKGMRQTMLEFDISLLPGASLYLEALQLEGKIEVEDTTSIGQSKMSYLTFVNCTVEPPEPDAKQLELAQMEMYGLQDPSASAWRGWLMLRDAALTLQIHDSRLYGGAFVEQSPNFNLSASKSYFDLKGQGFQLFNVTSHIQLEKVEVHGWGNRPSFNKHPSFNMVLGQHEVHVAGSTFYGSAIQIKESLHLILNVGGNTQFLGGDGCRCAIVVGVHEGHTSQVDLQDVKINEFSEFGVGASDFQSATVFSCLSQCRSTDQCTQVLIFDLSAVKLDNIQIQHAGVGACVRRAEHLIAKNMDISHTQTGILLDGSMEEVELEGVKMKHVGTGLKALSAFSAKDLEISETKTAIVFQNADGPSQASGVSISNCSVAVECDHCDSLSLDDVLIAGNVQALESDDSTNFQTSSGLVLFNGRDSLDTLAINQGKGASVLIWSGLPCPIAEGFSYLACGFAAILSRIGLEQHFSGGFETTSYGQMRKYILAGASLLLWIVVVEAVEAAFLLCTMRWTYDHQRQVHLEIVKRNAARWLQNLCFFLQQQSSTCTSLCSDGD